MAGFVNKFAVFFQSNCSATLHRKDMESLNDIHICHVAGVSTQRLTMGETVEQS